MTKLTHQDVFQFIHDEEEERIYLEDALEGKTTALVKAREENQQLKDRLAELEKFIIEDVPHKYQKRLLNTNN